MKLKKFVQFVKEDLNPIETEEFITDELPGEEIASDEVIDGEEFDSPEALRSEVGDELPEDEFDNSDDDDFDEEIDDVDVEVEDDEDADLDEEEEEGSEYEGTKKMKDLAAKLGTEVVNNQIDYNGQKINYYSETEKFHIGKQKFENEEEVLNFLNPKGVEEKSPEVEESPEVVEDELVVGESMKYLKKFK
jgi:hypothetical protein